MQTFDEMLGGLEHIFCLRHLYANFKKKFGGGTLIRDLMMAAAKATYVEAWEEKMQEIKKLSEPAYKWLMAVPKKGWCKHAFSFHTKCDVFMNNSSESFNATILLQRDKPIITMFEWIRTRVGNRPGRPTGAYGLACLSLAWPDLFMKEVRLRLLKKPI